MIKMVSINLPNNEVRKLPESTLDAYSLKKYNTFYEDSKTQVREDIRALSAEYNTIIPKDITVILFSELLQDENKFRFISKYKNKF